MWLYTVLRFGLFLALWGLLWTARVPGLLAATIALILSIPLSYILLRKQRARLAANLEARVTARQAQRHNLDAQLAGESEPTAQLADESEQNGPLPADPDDSEPRAAKPEPGAGRSAQ
jgi:sensor domain CHASE-containing protein